MAVHIREVFVSDSESIALLSEQLGYPSKAEQTAKRIRTIAESSDDCAFAAVGDGKILGWIHAFYTIRLESDPFVEIGGLVVDSSFRGAGVGKMLIERVKEWCHEKGCNDLRLRSNVKRLEAHKFYSHLGFTETKEQKVFAIRIG